MSTFLAGLLAAAGIATWGWTRLPAKPNNRANVDANHVAKLTATFKQGAGKVPTDAGAQEDLVSPVVNQALATAVGHNTPPADLDELTEGFEQILSQNSSGAAALSSKWNVDVYVPVTDDWSTVSQAHGRRPQGAELEQTLVVFANALGEYPSQFITALGFKKLLVVKDLYHKGVRTGMITMGPYDAIVGTAKMEALVHHELFHLVDYRMPRSSQWTVLNPSGFRYMGSGREMAGQYQGRGKELIATRADIPGFVSRYSTADDKEDRAELFAAMMSDPRFVSDRCRVDSVLRAKVALIKEIVATLSPTMNDAFWEVRGGP